jgi:hypothetical protein
MMNESKIPIESKISKGLVLTANELDELLKYSNIEIEVQRLPILNENEWKSKENHICTKKLESEWANE